MRVRRLGWAGVEIEQDGGTLLIDYVLDASQLPCATPRSLFHAPSSRRARWRRS